MQGWGHDSFERLTMNGNTSNKAHTQLGAVCVNFLTADT